MTCRKMSNNNEIKIDLLHVKVVIVTVNISIFLPAHLSMTVEKEILYKNKQISDQQN